MPTPTPTALKTQIEQALAAEIFKFAGVTGSAQDPDLTAGQRIKEATGGYLLLPNDLKKGPLVRLKLMQMVKNTDLVGNGEDGRSVMYSGKLRVVGITATSDSITKVCNDRDMLDQVVLLNLLKSLDQVTASAQNLTGGKAAYAAEINHLSTVWDEYLTEGEKAGAKLWAADFTQEWELVIEQTAGN